ncbi:isomerase YbhE [Rhizoctonia solani]|uniref:Isomerase YbhE n=1 Tax=Rhizoctonia solani TaxID=456999 RepID=A0A8H7I398_9AGAM|nr:isomerase YbhE [Rhizoctonia solani]
MAYKLLVGGYTATIATLLFNPSSSELSTIATSPAGYSPSWIVQHPANKSVVFATQELLPTGSILSFVVQQSGQLTQIGSPIQEAVAMNVRPIRRRVFSLILNILRAVRSRKWHQHPLAADKIHFGNPYQTVAFNGTGPNQSRQEKSHPHQVIEYGNEYLVPDLRTKFGGSQRLVPAHFKIAVIFNNPLERTTSRTTLYTLHELSSTLTQQTIPALGTSTQAPITSSVSIIPPGSSNPSAFTAAELLLSPISSAFPKQYLYATNRGDSSSDAVTIVDIEGNTLKIVGYVPTGLKQLRGASLSPGDGKYLALSGQGTGDVAIFERINGGTGLKQIAKVTALNSQRQ